MALKDLNLSRTYDSDKDDILNDFYIPVLSQSSEYYRIAGFFSSTSLAAAAFGLEEFIKNEGHIRLITGARLSEKDIEVMKRVSQSPKTFLAEKMLEDINSISESFIDDHVSALGWLIAKNMLTIKIAIVTDKNGNYLAEDKVGELGIFHPKIGILGDDEGNELSFSGSENETANAWIRNIEEFKIFRSWKPTEKSYLKSDVKRFKKFWSGELKRTKVINLPTAVEKKLMEKAPRDIKELNLKKWKNVGLSNNQVQNNDKFNPENLTPWQHQKRALKSIEENNYNGILKMATGTGKTPVALFIIEDYLKEIKRTGNRFLTLVPGKVLGKQWEDFWSKHKHPDDLLFRYDSDSSLISKRDAKRAWKSDFGDTIRNLFLIITVQSLGNFDFKNLDINFLIADEVHSYGTKNYMQKIKLNLVKVSNKLGLSATPERYYDKNGTKRILDYFGPIVFQYGIKEAQKEKKRSNGSETVLSNYNYYPYPVNLLPEEEEEVKTYSKKIGKSIAISFKKQISENEDELPKDAEGLMRQRAKVCKKAQNKLEALRNILQNERYFDRCLVYCEDRNQLNEVERVFKDINIDSYIVYHSMIEKRGEALNIFKENNCNFILSMHCLDQGVDIQDARSLILMSSSGNPREYIQRRGRVLRNYEGKMTVRIYDTLAFPTESLDIYRGMVETRLLRAWEFIRCSETPEAKLKLDNIKRKFDISDQELESSIEEWK